MPIPTPRGDEGQDEFISRCISQLTEEGEFDTPEQRQAVCFETWRDHKSASMTDLDRDIRRNQRQERT